MSVDDEDPYLKGIRERWPGNEQTVADLNEMATPTPITRENVDELLDTGQLQIHMKNGNWWDCRRNGATRRWKKDTSRIYIPFKYGFKFYGNITEHDFSVPTTEAGKAIHNPGNDGALEPLFFRVKPPPGVEDRK